MSKSILALKANFKQIKLKHQISIVLCTFLTAGLAHASVDLGGLSVLSAKGQPFKAQIDLGNLTPEEFANLKLKAKAINSGKNFNISLDKQNNGYVARISYPTSLDDEIIDIAVQARLAEQIVSEKSYGVAQEDIPEKTEKTNKEDKQSIVKELAKNKPSEIYNAKAKPEEAKRNTRDKNNQNLGNSNNNSSSYQVKQGDTLSEIAGKVARQVGGVSLDQVQVAIFESNRQAFINQNINTLKSNTRLNLPTEKQITSITPKAAKLQILANSGQYNRYRNQIADLVSKRAPEKQENDAGKVAAQAAPVQIAPENQDTLKLTKAMSASASTQEETLAKQLKLQEEATKAKTLEEIAKQQDKLKTLQQTSSAPISAASSNANTSSAASTNIASQTPPAEGNIANNGSASAATPTVQTDEQKSLEQLQNTMPTSAPTQTLGQSPLNIEGSNNQIAQIQNANQNDKSTFWPWGVGIAAIIGGVGLWVHKRRKDKNQTLLVANGQENEQEDTDLAYLNSLNALNTSAPSVSKVTLPSAASMQNSTQKNQIKPMETASNIDDLEDDLDDDFEFNKDQNYIGKPTIGGIGITPKTNGNTNNVINSFDNDAKIDSKIDQNRIDNMKKILGGAGFAAGVVGAVAIASSKEDSNKVIGDADFDDINSINTQSTNLQANLQANIDNNAQLFNQLNTQTELVLQKNEIADSKTLQLNDLKTLEEFEEFEEFEELETLEELDELQELQEFDELDELEELEELDELENLEQLAAQEAFEDDEEAQPLPVASNTNLNNANINSASQNNSAFLEDDYEEDEEDTIQVQTFYDTKLELAKAYMDIQDLEGARNLLDELSMQNEQPAIKAQAKSLLERL